MSFGTSIFFILIGILMGAPVFLFDLGYRFPEAKLDENSFREYDPFHIGALFASYASVVIGLFGLSFNLLPNNKNILWPNIFLCALGLTCLFVAIVFLYSKSLNQFILKTIPKHWVPRYWPARLIKTHFGVSLICFTVLIFDLILILN